MPSRVLSIVLALLQVVTSVGATPFVLDASRAQFRAAALKGDGSRVFLAAYDRDAVWVFDATSREKLAEIVVGDGPAALALSRDGKYLLCANRLGNSVSIIDSSTNAVLRTDNVGDAPSAAVALSDGRFAVVSTFADTVYPGGPRVARESARDRCARAGAHGHRRLGGLRGGDWPWCARRPIDRHRHAG
jgi:YVTN family beta-propeller protein